MKWVFLIFYLLAALVHLCSPHFLKATKSSTSQKPSGATINSQTGIYTLLYTHHTDQSHHPPLQLQLQKSVPLPSLRYPKKKNTNNSLGRYILMLQVSLTQKNSFWHTIGVFRWVWINRQRFVRQTSCLCWKQKQKHIHLCTLNPT